MIIMRTTRTIMIIMMMVMKMLKIMIRRRRRTLMMMLTITRRLTMTMEAPHNKKSERNGGTSGARASVWGAKRCRRPNGKYVNADEKLVTRREYYYKCDVGPNGGGLRQTRLSFTPGRGQDNPGGHDDTLQENLG